MDSMNAISIPAHFDGVHILLDEPYNLSPHMKLLVTVLPEVDEEREAWLGLSAGRLTEAYAHDEPEYSVSSIKEANPT